MKRPAIQIIAAVIGFVTALAAFNLIKKWDAPSGQRRHTSIGQFTAIQGSVERKSTGSLTTETVPNPRPLYNQDLVITQHAATATVQLLPDGPTLRINENTRFVAEMDINNPGSFVATVLDGTITVLNPGRKDSLRLFYEGRETSPNDLEKKSVPVIVENPNLTESPAPSTSPSAEPTLAITITAAPAVEAPPQPENTPAIDSAVIVDSNLSNEEIIRTLKSQTGLFQRCYLGFIHRSGKGGQATAGQITMSFMIQPNGKVTAAQSVRSDFKDPTLINCVTEVFERTRFRAFKGAAIPVLEFPISLN